jgi:hypothetical protein
MPTFTGTLNSNEIFGAIWNMIISQQVFANPISTDSASIVDSARVDGGLYGDTKLYYSTDALKSYEWANDAEATNLLALHRPDAPEVQAITLDIFRQIPVTVDNYLTKRAFADEGTFAQFNGVVLGWLRDTKRVYDLTTYNAFLGCEITNVGNQVQTVTGVAVAEPATEAAARLEAMTLGKFLADLFAELNDPNRDYNDYGHLRAYDEGRIKVIWNVNYLNRLRYIDLPTIFHNDNLIKQITSMKMLPKYFGTVNVAATVGNGSTVRSLIEQDIGNNHYFAGEIIANTDTAPAGTSYTEDDEVICKIVVGDLPPMMSAFETSTSFFNPKSLTENHYLTWGHNTLEHLKEYPFITLKASS